MLPPECSPVAAIEFFETSNAFDDLAEGSEAGFDVVAGGVVDVDLQMCDFRSGS
jgi:hypothetical protein